MRRDDIASTLIGHYFDTLCPLDGSGKTRISNMRGISCAGLLVFLVQGISGITCFGIPGSGDPAST